MPAKPPTTCVLSIAGSDSSGGAGIAVDLKTFAAFGVHGLAAITAVTAQTARAVAAIHCIPAAHVQAQIRSAFAGFRIGAVKIGMLGSTANTRAVVHALRETRARAIVLDPVLAASSGAALLTKSGLRILRDELIPLATVITPNLPEAEILLGRHIADPAQAARDLLALGARAVLLKGGHGRGAHVCDVLADAHGVAKFRHPRLRIRARGTGCALSAAVAAALARGLPVHLAVDAAETFLQHALATSYRTGASSIHLLGLSADTNM
ncbi:MAG: bifunctional hydroxymethylpyrimidine kinase/phosphomethylpyrimidine kinase [Rudaea sp.]